MSPKLRMLLIVRKIVRNSGGNRKAALKRVVMWRSAHPQIIEEGVVEWIVERMLDEVLAKSPNLNDEQAVKQTLRAIKALFQRPRKEVSAWFGRQL
jgi:hypothetical protein